MSFFCLVAKDPDTGWQNLGVGSASLTQDIISKKELIQNGKSLFLSVKNCIV